MSDISITPTELEQRVGTTLRQWRIDAGLSQDELAARASLSRSAVQAIELGRGTRLDTLIRVLRALGRADALDAFTPRTGPSPIERLAAERRAARTEVRAPRARRRDGSD